MKKLNYILADIKKGTVLTSTYFNSKDISPQLLNKYLKSTWFQSIGSSAYIRTGDKVDSFGAIYAIQKQLNLPIYLGGKTSLSLQNLVHYVPIDGLKTLEIYSLNYTKVPEWFKSNSWEVNLNYVNTTLFEEDSKQLNFGFIEKTFGDFSLTISSPERAILELLEKIPEEQSFDEAYKIMENLYNLRPDLLNSLLEKCKSIKVKRLFLFLSETINHDWFEFLHTSKFSLGSGKRLIAKNGIFNKKYMITVPKEFSNYEI